MHDFEAICEKIYAHYNEITPFTREEFGQIVSLTTVITLRKANSFINKVRSPKYGGFIIQEA
jgi:hypothetical protein